MFKGRKKIKKNIAFWLMVSCSVILIACEEKKPDVEIDFEISSINKKEYFEVDPGNKKEEKGKFKKVKFEMKISHSDWVKKRKVEMPDLEKIKNKIKEVDNGIKIWESQWEVKEMEKSAKYKYEMIVFGETMKEEEIKEIFENEKIEITWENSKNRKQKIEYNLYDVVEIKK